MQLRHYIYSLPLPPSANSLWRSGRKRTYKSEEYTTWQALSAKAIHEQETPDPPITKHYHLRLVLGFEIRPDIDNLLKATNDILQHCGVVANDKQNWTLEIARDKHIYAGFCHAQITELDIEKGK